jgi:hypothetical protein
METTDTYELLKRAILNKQQVVATYDGAVREFCPHVLGLKQGKRHVLAYQFAGASGSGLPASGEWRCFDVDRLGDAATQPGPWHSAANVFSPQSCLDIIDVVVRPFPPAALG